jgi:hypothetical protein
VSLKKKKEKNSWGLGGGDGSELWVARELLQPSLPCRRVEEEAVAAEG